MSNDHRLIASTISTTLVTIAACLDSVRPSIMRSRLELTGFASSHLTRLCRQAVLCQHVDGIQYKYSLKHPVFVLRRPSFERDFFLVEPVGLLSSTDSVSSHLTLVPVSEFSEAMSTL